MKNIFVFIVGLIIIVLETFFTNYIGTYFSVNILLIFVIFISLYIDRSYSLIITGILGLIGDLATGGIIGVTSILFLGTSYFLSSIEKSIFKDNKLIVSLLVFVVSIVYSILDVVTASIFFMPTPILVGLLKSVVVIPISNTVVAYVLYTIFSDKLIKLRVE
ncbi:MAG: rod shape-determining protein MreD [Peptostreptococcus porci]|uniref:rod shape-determining protein MreD n=1 Tax=Peptostreptococcus porci TaxID=2652282 RepID=UPI002A7F8A07|nr:rod shape-determining protein MreD [Peptostreptococcus porci]MDY4127394.1 rod shape-determining protein MreD [Peptostreptococcus porci]MDY5479126.1 rod shape-determining protein MreD [Peptostreptococcus porci]MDY5964443.1 rod shape-determining protein MreD [Peptostreptococcus porci]